MLYTKYTNNKICGIKPNNYSSRITQIMEMVAISKKDFPGLKDNDIRVVSYAGDRWKHQTGIEFNPPVDALIPEEYTEMALKYLFSGS